MKKLFTILLVLFTFTFISCTEDMEEKKELSMEEQFVKGCNSDYACGGEKNELNECITLITNIYKSDKNAIYIPMFKDIKDLLESRIDCYKKAENCKEVAICGDSILTDETCDDTFVSSCEGNKIVTCNRFKNIEKHDCGSNSKCVMDGKNPDCESTIEKECNMQTFKDSCSGNTLTTCLFGNKISGDCKDMFGDGYTCKDIQGKGSCVASETVETCNDTYTETCEGKIYLHCKDGKVAKTDCEKMLGAGFICKENASFTEKFLFAGCTHPDVAKSCDDTMKTSCDGDTLKYCINGEMKTFNCKDANYDSCMTEGEESYCNF